MGHPVFSVLALLLLSCFPSAQAAAYTSTGTGVVLADEGSTIGAYKEDCTPDPLDTCFQKTPDLAFCSDQCTANGACHSFAYCTGEGNVHAPFTRCYIKTRHVDLATIPHGSGDCTTYEENGDRLADADNHVARNEGANLVSIKPDCTVEPVDYCVKATPTFDSCHAACSDHSGCASFAYCTGNPKADFTRCYLKTANFTLVTHGNGDCSSYYPATAAMCKDVKQYYRDQSCCGAPSKDLDMNKAKPSGSQGF